MYGDHRVIKVCSKPVAGTAPCRISGGMLRACISPLRGALLYPGHFIQSPVCCHTGFAPESGLEDSGRHEEVLTLGCSEVQSPPDSSQKGQPTLSKTSSSATWLMTGRQVPRLAMAVLHLGKIKS